MKEEEYVGCIIWGERGYGMSLYQLKVNEKEWIEFGKRLKHASQMLDDAMNGRPVQKKLEEEG